MTPEMRAAFIRAWPYAATVALFNFLMLLPDPAVSWRTAISMTFVPAISVLGWRWLGEGWYDSARAQRQLDIDKRERRDDVRA